MFQLCRSVVVCTFGYVEFLFLYFHAFASCVVLLHFVHSFGSIGVGCY
jgi:hypothetical protein